MAAAGFKGLSSELLTAGASKTVRNLAVTANVASALDSQVHTRGLRIVEDPTHLDEGHRPEAT